MALTKAEVIIIQKHRHGRDNSGCDIMSLSKGLRYHEPKQRKASIKKVGSLSLLVAYI